VIVDAILGLLFDLFSYLLGLLPTFSTPSWLGSSSMCGGESRTAVACYADQLGSSLNVVNKWVNIELLAATITICMAVLLAMAGVRVTIWLYDHFPGKSE